MGKDKGNGGFFHNKKLTPDTHGEPFERSEHPPRLFAQYYAARHNMLPLANRLINIPHLWK